MLAVKFQRVGFIGSGRMGTALSLAMCNAGYDIEMVASRSLDTASSLASKLGGCEATDNFVDLQERCDLIFLTVPDKAITEIASDFQWRKGQAVIHCSGVLALKFWKRQGCEVLMSARCIHSKLFVAIFAIQIIYWALLSLFRMTKAFMIGLYD